VHVAFRVGRAYDGDDAEFERLLVVAGAIGPVEGEGELGRRGAFAASGGEDVGVDDGIGIECAALVDNAVGDFEPNLFAGFEMGGVDAGDFGFDGGVGRDGGVGESGTSGCLRCGRLRCGVSVLSEG